MKDNTNDNQKVQYYLNTLATYEKEFSKWDERTNRIIKRYRDERPANTRATKYNILWSNVQTLKAATFSRMPKPDVSRRFKDNDPVARVASLLIERALDFEITHSHDFKETLTATVFDRFLGGRGTAWVRYEPIMMPAEEANEGAEVNSPDDFGISEQDLNSDEEAEYLDIETTPVDYVHWKDFGHSVARTWDEVTLVWRKVYMSREMLKERFPDYADKIPLDTTPEDKENKNAEGKDKKALIIEFWNKETETVCWLSKSLGKIIDERDDPLELEGFWPCPKPLFATLTNESLVPVPDFTLYQDQANELDILSDRIKGLIDALKVRGVYDAGSPELARLFTEGENGSLLPVKNFAAFAEKQGLRGSIDLVDLTPIANALNTAYTAMGQVKQQVYDITGISDIVRGASNANETATAQQIKGQYASLRLKTFQDEVANFASSILKIKAQIICQHFQPETIMKIGGAELMNDADKQLLPQAMELIKNNPMRTFRIEVATDSMLYQDEQQEKQDRVEFMTATSSFLEKAIQGGQQAPDLVPLMLDLLKFGVTGYRVGRNLEGEFDNTADMMKQKMAQPKPPQPNPDAIKAQAEMQKSQSEMQLEQMKMQMAQQQAQADAQLQQAKLQLEQSKLEFEQWKVQLENDTKVLVAEMQAKNSIKQTAMTINGAKEAEGLTEIDDEGMEQPTSALASLVDAVNNNMASMIAISQQHNQDILNQQQMAHENLTAQLTRPKQVLRDANGKIMGVH